LIVNLHSDIKTCTTKRILFATRSRLDEVRNGT